MEDHQSQSYSDTRYLHRRVLKTYWTVLLLSVIAEAVASVITVRNYPEVMHSYWINKVLIPTSIQVGVLTINEIAFRMKRERPILFLVSGTCIASSLVMANQSIHVQVLFLLSMLVSLFYFNLLHLYIAFTMNMAAFMLIFATNPYMRQKMTWYELFAFIFIMIGLVYILKQVIQRGNEILADLMRTVKSKQELLVKNALMDRMVKRDALTDLYNHKTFHEYLELLAEASERGEFPLQLAVIDIDNFKCINDTFGHAVGDLILARVAGTLTESFTPNEIVARYGGEEFAVLFPGKTLKDAYLELEHARIRIQQLNQAETGGRQVTVSIGLAEFRKGYTKAELFAEADGLLYAAKRNGKNRTMKPADL